MPGPEEYYPPYQYGWGWLVLAVGIIVFALACWALALWFTRTHKPPKAIPALAAATPKAADVLTQLRYEYAMLIDQIEGAYRAGALDAKAANRELSVAVRQFVNEYSGLEAPVLTLTDLIAQGVHPALIDAIQRHYYPSIFRRDMVIDPFAGANAARTVVTSWH